MSKGYTHEELLAVLNGDDLEEYRRKTKFRSHISDEAKKYFRKPSSEWPPISFNWDLKKESQIYSLDGITEEDFKKFYPEGFLLGHVSLSEFDKKLCHYSRRDEGELWEVGFPSSLAYLIVYLSEGHPISPPLVKPAENREVIFHGGHHRYAIAKEIGEDVIPIHVCPEDQKELENILEIRW